MDFRQLRAEHGGATKLTYMLSEKSDKILEVDKLRKSHPNHDGANKDDLTVIDNVSFDVKEEEFVTVIGPSGCGKSTLLSIIARSRRVTTPGTLW